MKPKINKEPDAETLAKISYTRGGKKVIGSAHKAGVTIYFYEDGSESIENNEGNKVTWPGDE